MSRHDVITAGLSNVNLSTAGYLSPLQAAGTSFRPLLWSSADAMALAAQSLAGLTDPASVLSGFKPTGKRYVFAARVSGKVKSAYPHGPPAGVKLPAGTQVLTEAVKPLQPGGVRRLGPALGLPLGASPRPVRSDDQ